MSEDPVTEGARGGRVAEVISHAAGGRSLEGSFSLWVMSCIFNWRAIQEPSTREKLEAVDAFTDLETGSVS